jgi:hypothetical protein
VGQTLSLSNILGTLNFQTSFASLAGGMQCNFYFDNLPFSVNQMVTSITTIFSCSFAIFVFFFVRYVFRHTCCKNLFYRSNLAGSKSGNEKSKVPTIPLMTISLIVLIYILYENVLNSWFQFFACSSFSGDALNGRLVTDLDVVCYSQEHYKWLLVLALPVGVGIILGLPSVMFLKLYMERYRIDPGTGKNGLEMSHMKNIYGFIYTGFKKDKYYWEAVSLSKKIALSAVSIFLKSLADVEAGLNRQGLAALAILMFYLWLHLYVRPYESDMTNQLETLGLVVSTLTGEKTYHILFLFNG